GGGRDRGDRGVEARERQNNHDPGQDEAHARHEGAHPSRARVAEEHRELRRRRTGQEIREREPFEEPLFAEPAALLLDLRLHHAEDADTAKAHRAEREEGRRNLVHGMDLCREDPGCRCAAATDDSLTALSGNAAASGRYTRSICASSSSRTRRRWRRRSATASRRITTTSTWRRPARTASSSRGPGDVRPRAARSD